VDVPAGKGADVRPHPHIGLATITYLLLGEVQHRDSLGSNQIIRPGDVNWMVAGRGITHSELTPAETRERPHTGHGIQTWVALPKTHEDAAPKFEHHAKGTLPVIESDDVRLRLVLGRAYGETAPASVFSDSFYADVQLAPGARIPLPEDHEERGLYVLEGSVSVAGQSFDSGRMPGIPAQRPHRRRGGARGRAPHPFGRRAARRAALHLVEFCRLKPGEDRRRKGGMAQGRLGLRPV
jgi:redox-sensitive bicupin YhaK (pirin superfamily)